MKYACKHCGKLFEEKQKLGGHSRSCDMNPRHAEMLQQLAHARSQVSKGRRTLENLLQCKFCDKLYDTHTGMNLHVWKVHGKGVDNDPNVGFKNGTRSAWSKGLTKETDERVRRISERISVSKTGKPRYDLRKDRDISNLKDYRHACGFKFNLADFPDEFDFSLVESYGWYKAKNRGDNLNGVSRDHMVSVSFGFSNGIDPSIISHPANCRLVRHNENVSKGAKCTFTLKELLERIEAWNLKYHK